jgi:hypothetical protein
MSKKMTLSDIADMDDYLENRCYCPYEIYDMSGFFFQIFKPETECKHLIAGERGAIHGVFVIAKTNPYALEQIIYIEITGNNVDSCIMFDATANNIDKVLKFMNGKIDKMTLDEFEKGATAKSLEEISRVADAIMV